MRYFFLGNTPDLSRLELNSVFKASFVPLKEGIVSCVDELDEAVFERLGGTRKIATFITVVKPSELIAKLTEIITADSAKNIAITDYAGTELSSAEVISIKKVVRESRPIRFVSTETGEHELLMLAHQHVSEFNLLPNPEGIVMAKTTWIYDAESWVKRDRQKPYRDIKRGMLPPKLARIMVNLGTEGKNVTLLDPFCGTGTILTEALLSGCSVIGTDNDSRAVEGALKNCAWLKDVYQLPDAKYHGFVSDVTHVRDHVKKTDVIVTEPYMGPLVEDRYVPSYDKLAGIARGLDKLYRGAFKAWYNLLPVGGRIVISIPRFVAYNRPLETISIDTLKALGYNYIDSVAYGKPGAVVVRNITILEKK
jgi:tRNA G10  N-methylase Trm11